MTRSLRNKVDNSLESPTIQYGRDELIKFIQAISSEAERNNICLTLGVMSREDFRGITKGFSFSEVLNISDHAFNNFLVKIGLASIKYSRRRKCTVFTLKTPFTHPLYSFETFLSNIGLSSVSLVDRRPRGVTTSKYYQVQWGNDNNEATDSAEVLKSIIMSSKSNVRRAAAYLKEIIIEKYSPPKENSSDTVLGKRQSDEIGIQLEDDENVDKQLNKRRVFSEAM